MQRVDSRRARHAFAGCAFDDLPVAVLYFAGPAMVEANAEWVAISRLGVTESAGEGWLTAIHPDDRANAAEFVATPTSGPDADLSLRVVPIDGQASWFRARRRSDDACARQHAAAPVDPAHARRRSRSVGAIDVPVWPSWRSM